MTNTIDGTQKKWTILAYISGDSNIEAPEVNALLQLEKAGSSDQVNIVAQLDRRTIPEEDAQYRLGVDGDWDTARRYRIEKGAEEPSEIKYDLASPSPSAEIIFKTGKISTPPSADLGEVNMASPKTLQEFIEWGIRNYPAEHYMILFMDHGFGYLGAMQDESSMNIISLPGMKEAIKGASQSTGKKIDIIGFDACLMGTVEAAYQFRDVADIFISSQELETVPGWPLANIFNKISERCETGAMTPREVAECIIAESRQTPFAVPTLSAVDLKKLEPVKQAADKLAGDLLEPGISPYYTRKAIRSALHFGDANVIPMGDQTDIVDMCGHIADEKKITNPKIREDCRALAERMKEAVICEEHAGKGMLEAHGLSIYACTFTRAFDPCATVNPITNNPEPDGKFSYRNLDFAKDNKWQEFLRTKFAKVS